MIDLKELYERRPFKTRNADELDLSVILDLFVDPQKALRNPFEFENTIIKGKMGTGKTMYLKANQAYYLFTLIPSLLLDEEPIIPVYIRLSDYQHIGNPEDIYKQLILRVIKELCSSYEILLNAESLYYLHKGFLSIPSSMIKLPWRVKDVLESYKKLSSEEYVETVKKEIGISATAKPKIFELFAKYFQTNQVELKKKPNPGVIDIEDAYNYLLKARKGKILLLLDEAGSVNKNFFKNIEDQDSFFEIFMNQLRTLPFLRTKVAVYPQTYTDILTETRYGDIVFLQENIEDLAGYISFNKRAESIIEKYCENAMDVTIGLDDVFKIDIDEMNPIEQLINASYGNMRRFLNLVDVAFQKTYESSPSKQVEYKDVIDALQNNCIALESMYPEYEKAFLNTLASACRSRATFKFSFPNNAPAIYRYTGKSSEYNVINIIETGNGRRSNVYAFDYAYCVKNQIPTHYIRGTERIDKSRSIKNGEWVSKITTLSEEILANAEMPGKIEGVIEYLKDDIGFIKGDDGNSYFYSREYVIETDKAKKIYVGKRVRFHTYEIDKNKFSSNIEVL